MVFTNIEQFDIAKKTLIQNNKNIESSTAELKKNIIFEGIETEEIKESLLIINEGIKDNIINFISKKLGGDISKIKTILDQIKQIELKFNKEEIEIYSEFYRIIEDEKQLEKDKSHPSHKEFFRELEQSKSLLNKRLNELNKTTSEMLDSLEYKAKELIENNERKKKYFNLQRASDVLETRKDRYEKIKSLTAKNSKRSQNLEDFFGTKSQKLEKDIESSEKDLKKYSKGFSEKYNKNTPGSVLNQYSVDPEMDFSNRLFYIKELIEDSPKDYNEKIEKSLEELIKEIDGSLLFFIKNHEKRKTLSEIRNECSFVKQSYKKIK